MTTAAPSFDELMTETEWLRGLARALVKDRAAADDVVQDTVLIAAERAPRDGRPLRPWLARVLLNRVRMGARASGRRDRRERAVAELASAPATPDALVDRVRTQRLLADLVLALDPPLRQVILLRYVEGLTSVEIGRRLGIGDATVRWRMQRAIGELRERLEERHPQRAWVPALVSFAGTTRAPIGGAALAIVALAAIVIVAGGLLAWLVSAPPATATSPSRTVVGPSGDDRARLELAEPGRGPVSIIDLDAPGKATMRITGIVVDRDDHAVAGVDLRVGCLASDDPIDTVTRTQRDGRFAFEVDRDRDCTHTVIVKTDREIGRGFVSTRDRRQAIELTLRVHPIPQATIKVVDATTGAPIPDARLWSDYYSGSEADAISNRVGVAHLGLDELAPMGDFRSFSTIVVAIDAPGYPSISTKFTSSDVGSAAIQRTVKLTRGVPVAGRVVDAAGRGVGGARVMIRDDRDTEIIGTDASGAFAIAVPSAGRYRASVRPLRDPAHENSAPEAEIEVGPAGRADVELALRLAPARALTGSVVDASGHPVASARVGGAGVTVPTLRSVVTDAHGRFSLPIGSPGWPLEVFIVARYEALASQVIPVSLANEVPANLTLQLGPTGVSGVVVDLDGNPVADADIYVNPCNAPQLFGEHVSTDAEGRFAFDAPRVPLTVSVRRSGEDDFDDRDDRVVVGGSRNVRLTLP